MATNVLRQDSRQAGEAIFAAARAIAIGQEGESHEREVDAQMNRTSSLMLLVATLFTWNTVYLDKVVTMFRVKRETIPDAAPASPGGIE